MDREIRAVRRKEEKIRDMERQMDIEIGAVRRRRKI